jgi:hypothetical protein
LGQGLKNRAKELPEKLPSSEVVVAKSKHFLEKGKETIMRYSGSGVMDDDGW